ncbi:hypothetical protein HDU91_006605 [Kappamyces sp. JEL0680]|nr:hypothetical protein HDU91_006605 [Kappamyces sp. JEL0680]
MISTISTALRLTAFAWNCVVMCICLPFLIYYRKLAPIYLRSWTIKLAGSMFVLAALLLQSVQVSFSFLPSTQFYLLFSYAMLWTLSVASLLPVLIRHYFLLQAAMIQTRMMEGDVAIERSLLQRTKRWTSEKSAWLVYFAWSFVPVVSLVVVFALTSQNLDTISFFVAFNAQLFVIALVTISFAFWYLARSPADNFGIKYQFMSSVGLVFLSTIFIGIVLIVKDQSKFALVTTVIVPTAVMLTDLVWPLVVCYRITRDNANRQSIIVLSSISSKTQSMSPVEHLDDYVLSSVLEENKTPMRIPQRKTSTVIRDMVYSAPQEDSEIDKILADPTLTLLFAMFLAREYSLENLLFLQAVSKLFMIPPEQSVQYITSRSILINEFIVQGSANQVNLPGQLVTTIVTEDPTSREGMSQADRHIRSLLKANCLSRFCETL